MDRDLLNHLPVVLSVARRGGFAAAAAELGMSPSASPVRLLASQTFGNIGHGHFDSESPVDIVGAGRSESAKHNLVVLPQVGNCMVR